MRESELRPVLLVKAIEESDEGGTLLPPADRLAAAQAAKRAAPPRGALRLEQGRLPVDAQRLLRERAAVLLGQVRARHPFVEEIVAFSPGASLALIACTAAFAIGILLSALDGSQRINVLAFPLWGLVAWNLFVYAAVAGSAARSLDSRRRARRWIPEHFARIAMRRLSASIARARRFHAPLAQALARFLGEWQEAVQPAMAWRAAAIFHLAAAVLGAGLIAGFYLRGIALDYRAGWESTFLDAQQARAVLRVLYGPASLLTGIPIPDASHLEAMRWHEGRGGESAAPWIHLLAATALIFVVVPRLVLAALARVGAWRAANEARMPASMAAYFERSFRDVGIALAGGGMRVVPIACDPTPASLDCMRAQWRETLLDVRPALAYGEEGKVAAALREGEGVATFALLFTAAATPEEEIHGRAIDAAREAARASDARVEAIVDEAPYASRMGQSLESRLEERRRAWRRLVEAHGVDVRFVNLAA